MPVRCTCFEHPPHDAHERAEQLRALGCETRLHTRLAARLAKLSPARQFHEPADALRVLRDDLEARIGEIDRARMSALRLPVDWPDAMQELLAAVEGREERTTA